MKIQDVLGFQEIYPEIANIKLPLQTVYKLAKISQKLEQEYNFYQSNFNKILDEFALRKEDGSYEVSEDGASVKLQPDKINECARSIEELQNVTISEPDAYLSIDMLDADLSLYTGGYRAGETTFNMLTQVVGRAGRGDTPGRAMIQTLVPEHQVIRLASRQDYDGFYKLEIRLRQVQEAPPFGDIAAVTFTGQEETALLRGAAKFRDSLVSLLKQKPYANEYCTVLGPAPCAVAKINYNFRYRLTLRCRMTKNLRLLLAHLLRQFSKDKQNRGVTAFIDVNGFE